MHRLIVVCLLVACAPTLAKPRWTPALRSADLLGDLAVLERSYRALHPGLARYNTPAQLDAAFATLRDAWSHDQPLGEAYVSLTRFTATLRCGHSYPNYFNQAPQIQAALFEEPRVPFLFRWLGGHMVVTRDFSGSLPRGTEITRLAGVRTDELLARFLPLARSDGHNDAKRIDDFELHGDSKFEAFDIYWPLVAPHSTEMLEVETTSGVRRVAFQTASARRTAQQQADSDGPAWTLAMRDGVGYVKMGDWALYNSKWDWKADLQTMFETLVAKQARGLIVDVRGNEGGLDVGNVVLAHLISTDLPVTTLERRVRYRSVPAELRAPLDTWDKSFFDWGDDAIPLGDGWFHLRGDDETASGEQIHPAGPRFTGKVVILVDAANSSATFQFAQLAQTAHLATLVGSPTGGNQRGINGGAFFFVRLPATKLEVDLPLIGRFAKTQVPDAGLTPDRIAIPSVSDIANGIDRALDAAYELTGTVTRAVVPSPS